ncbi:hypothetical protein ACLMJK_006432 [Lecanora helva]
MEPSNKADRNLTSGVESATESTRKDSFSHNSQTASEFIDNQLQLEADAREALPYKFEHCTQPLGPLRQNLFSCLTCNPPPESPSAPYTPAAVCYSCSIACHGEHTLVELFNRRNFTCDCGTTRLPATSPCTLRIDPTTGLKAPVHSQPAPKGNTYNQNCRNRFCGCGELYDAHEEKGTMFQCLGLTDEAVGGCGEDWWHPECVVGLGRNWAKASNVKDLEVKTESNGEDPIDEEQPLPPRFPQEDLFETFICYKCVASNPWIKKYAGAAGFLPPVYKSGEERPVQESNGLGNSVEGNSTIDLAAQVERKNTSVASQEIKVEDTNGTPNTLSRHQLAGDTPDSPKKRTADAAELDDVDNTILKKPKADAPYHAQLPAAPTGAFSLFCKEDFREHLCRCPECYPDLKAHPQFLEEEESYEPPVSESGEEGEQSVGTRSLLDRGEAALSNVDRVRAIEGVMVYNHLKDKVKNFLQPFAESGEAVGAEDIKAYFEKLRGDEQGIRQAAVAGADSGGDGTGDNRREQSGY